MSRTGRNWVGRVQQSTRSMSTARVNFLLSMSRLYMQLKINWTPSSLWWCTTESVKHSSASLPQQNEAVDRTKNTEHQQITSFTKTTEQAHDNIHDDLLTSGHTRTSWNGIKSLSLFLELVAWNYWKMIAYTIKQFCQDHCFGSKKRFTVLTATNAALTAMYHISWHV